LDNQICKIAALIGPLLKLVEWEMRLSTHAGEKNNKFPLTADGSALTEEI